MSTAAAIFEYTTGKLVRLVGHGNTDTLDRSGHYLVNPLPPGQGNMLIASPDPAFRLMRTGPTVGRYEGFDIPEWISMGDGKLRYYRGTCGMTLEIDHLKLGQIVIMPGLIFDETPPPMPAAL